MYIYIYTYIYVNCLYFKAIVRSLMASQLKRVIFQCISTFIRTIGFVHILGIYGKDIPL